MAKKNFIRLDKVNKQEYIETVIHPTEELINGHLVNLGTVLKTSEGEAVDFEFATEGKGFDAIVAPVYLDKGYPGYDITKDSIPAGKPARAFHLPKGAIVSINQELAVGVVKGDSVAVAAEGLGFKKALEGETVVGKCIDINYYPYVGDLAVIRFV